MAYYDDTINVEKYIRMAAEYDGKLLVEAIGNFLAYGSRVLELGMGPAKDTLMLSQHYQVIGSDSSTVFVERFRKLHPNVRVELLDAITLETEDQYQGIYSNKVLYHLTRDELLASFRRQAHVLTRGGIALHSFWHGDEEGEHQGLHSVYVNRVAHATGRLTILRERGRPFRCRRAAAYYSEDSMKALIGSEYNILDTRTYTEIESHDSFYIVLRKR